MNLKKKGGGEEVNKGGYREEKNEDREKKQKSLHPISKWWIRTPGSLDENTRRVLSESLPSTQFKSRCGGVGGRESDHACGAEE